MGDVNQTMRTWVAGEVVTAAEMNTEIRDPLTSMQSTWAPYAGISWSTTGTAPAIGNGTLTGVYNRIGRTHDFVIQLVAGSTTTFGTGNWSFTLPNAAAYADVTFAAYAFDTSAGAQFPAAATTVGSSTSLPVRIWPAAAGGAFAAVTNTAPMTWATGDRLTINGRFLST